MDKAQKQLIKTYYRKRNIVINRESKHYKKYMLYKVYEINKYAMDNNFLDFKLDDIENKLDMINMLRKNPDLFDNFKDIIKTFDSYDQWDLLKKRPQNKKFLKYIKDKNISMTKIFHSLDKDDD